MDTILVVDDDRTFTGLLKTIFELEGYHTEILKDPGGVIDDARRIEPVLILMDVHTGRENTLDTLRALKSDPDLKRIPVVMTSGIDHSEECYTAGAETFILKPFRPSELLQRIDEMLGNR